MRDDSRMQIIRLATLLTLLTSCLSADVDTSSAEQALRSCDVGGCDALDDFMLGWARSMAASVMDDVVGGSKSTDCQVYPPDPGDSPDGNRISECVGIVRDSAGRVTTHVVCQVGYWTDGTVAYRQCE